MTRYYDRESKLKVFTTDGTNTELADFSSLDFDFEISSKSPYRKDGKNKTTPITAEAKVYKLNQASRDKLSAEGAALEIQTGYNGDLATVFSGVIINIDHRYEAPDWVTHIWASDSWANYASSYFSRSYKAGVAIKTIINDVAGSFAVPVVNRYDRTDTLLTGTVLDGKSKDVMDRLARDYDLNWDISSDAVTIIDALDPPLVDRSRVVILSDTVLKGPIIEESLENEKKKNKKVTRRVRAVTLLEPSIASGTPVRFKAPSYERSFSDVKKTKFVNINENAIYICDEVVHRGSNWTKEHTTEILTREEKERLNA